MPRRGRSGDSVPVEEFAEAPVDVELAVEAREVLRLLADLRWRRRRVLALKVAGYSNPEVMKILSVTYTKVRGNGPSWVNTGWVGPSPARKML